MRSFYKKNAHRTRSVERKRLHFDIHSSYISYSHKPASITSKYSNPVLPESIRKSSKSRLFNYSNEERQKEAHKFKVPLDEVTTAKGESTLEGNSVYLTPVVVKSDLPCPKELIKRIEKKQLAQLKKPNKIKLPCFKESDSLRESRLKEQPNSFAK